MPAKAFIQTYSIFFYYALYWHLAVKFFTLLSADIAVNS